MATITKAEFDALPDSLKPKFKADGDSFALVEEDVEGLKKSKAEILAEKKQLAEQLAELKKFKDEHEAKQTEADIAKEKEAGEFAKLEERLRAKIAEVEADRDAKVNGILGNLKTERLKNLVVEKGVLPDRAEYALTTLSDQFDLESGEQGFTLKLKNGIGDPKEIDGAIDGLKAKAAFLFAGQTQTGGGASGSGNNAGGGKSITRAQYDAAPDQYAKQLASRELTITD